MSAKANVSFIMHTQRKSEGRSHQASGIVGRSCLCIGLTSLCVAPSEITEADAVPSSIPETSCIDIGQFIPKDAH